MMKAGQASRGRGESPRDRTRIEAFHADRPRRFSFEHRAKCAMWIAIPLWIWAVTWMAIPGTAREWRVAAFVGGLIATCPAPLFAVAAYAGLHRILPFGGLLASACHGAVVASLAGIVLRVAVRIPIPMGAWALVGAAAGLAAAVIARAVRDPDEGEG